MTATLISFHKALEERVSGIPEIVVSIPSQEKETAPATTIALIDNLALSRSCIVHALRDKDHTVAEFTSANEVKDNYNIVIFYHHDGSEAATLLNLELLKERGSVVVIGDKLSTDTIREALHIGIKAYIPAADIDLDNVRNILKFIMTGNSFIPVSILGKSLARDPEKPFGLTERELLIIRLMHIGKQNKVIAYELGLSESTVKVHIRHILTKLNSRNRTEAVSVALKHGVVA